MAAIEDIRVLLVGHPFLPTGRGEDIRAAFHALRAAGVACHVLDIYKLFPHGSWTAIVPHLAPRITDGINIFYINSDEVEQALAHLGAVPTFPGYNIIVPAWELSRYPAISARQLERFHEVWALSGFTRDSLAGRVSVPVHHLSFASEVRVTSFLGRTFFAIPERTYAFLFLFDFTSYIGRKNPFAGVNAFDRLLRSRPTADVHFVIKLSGSQQRPEDYARFQEAIAPYADRVTVIDRILSDNEMKNLIRCCDCFLSLHRSEGLGRGLAEAMFLGKPVIATGYSGNMEFMTADNSLLVDYRLIPVEPGAYPHWEGQVWADADIEQAAGHMIRLVDDPASGRILGAQASRHLRQYFSYRAAGLRYRARLEAIAREAEAGGRQTVRIEPARASEG
jgi:glycosyltransferase involved in cell wall biosynthesis